MHRTCSMQRRPLSLALGTPDARCNVQQVLHNLRVALPAGDVEGVPSILVPQRGVSTVAQQLLDHTKIPPSAGHHQGSPEGGGRNITRSHSGRLFILKNVQNRTLVKDSETLNKRKKMNHLKEFEDGI